MGNEQRVTITVKDTGEVTWDDGGFHGTTCSKEAQKLLQSIGGTVVEDTKKPEYYEDGDNPVSILQK